MLQKHLFTTLFIIMPVVSISQDTSIWLATARRNDKVGCIDLKGKEIIPVQYDDVGSWGNGLIPVFKGIRNKAKGGRWGYCNNKGQLIIPLQFDRAERFIDGLAAVQKNGKWGFIDTLGKVAIPLNYDWVKKFTEGLCPVKINKQWGYIDKSGQMIIKPEFGNAEEFQNGVATAFVGQITEDDLMNTQGNYCLIDIKGNRITPPLFKYIWSFQEGLAVVEVPDSTDRYHTKNGFINTKGELVIPPVYDYAESFSEGRAVVGMKNQPENQFDSDNRYTYGYINTKGEEVIKMQFSMAYPFINGKAVVSKGKQSRWRFSVIDKKDSSITNYEEWPTYALIDNNGNYLLNFDWGQLSPIGSDLFIASRARYLGEGVINLKGETIVPFHYANLRYIGNNLFSANDGGAGGETLLLNSNNQILIRTKEFEMPASKYQFGLIDVRTNKLRKGGFVDSNGKWVIKDRYESISSFEQTSK